MGKAREVRVEHAGQVAAGQALGGQFAVGHAVKLGLGGARQLLQAGVNDLGGTLMDENISRAAGAEHGQLATKADFEALVGPLGRTLAQRTTLYGRVEPQQDSAAPQRGRIPVTATS